MARIVPSAVDFKLRFPAFASVADAQIEFVIEEALRFVDSTWDEEDYAPAIRYLTAHLLVCEGALDGANERSRALSGPVTGEALGDASISYGGTGSSSDSSNYSSTWYGQRYMELLRNNKGGPLIATGVP